VPETEPTLNSLHYRVRESARAKSLRLKVSLHQGLEVVVPKGFDHNQIPTILEHKQGWIEQATHQVNSHKHLCDPDNLRPLPLQIHLRGIAQVWQVEYCPPPTPGKTAGSARIVGDTHLRVQAPNTPAANQRVLRRWLQQMAQAHLVPWLHTKSQEADLPFHKVVIRTQKTRWGSCSQQGTINLNSQLLFLPPHLVDYVLLHELCHTVHLNHSAAFWELLQQKAPDYKAMVQDLRQAWCYVPMWVLN
jgi:predicted metal-dependent hydrolase